MKKTVKIIWRTVTVLLAVVMLAVVGVCVYILVRRMVYGDELPSVFGYAAATVESNSMDPTFSKGDVVVIKACDEYVVGDIVTYDDIHYGGYTTHRIIEINAEGQFITQGDAATNDVPDTYPVEYSQIVGKVVLVISSAGDFIDFLQTPAGLISVIAALIALWLVIELCAYVVKKIRKR